MSRPDVCPVDGLPCDLDCPEHDPCRAPGGDPEAEYRADQLDALDAEARRLHDPTAWAVTADPDRTGARLAEAARRAADRMAEARSLALARDAEFFLAPLRACSTCATSMHTRHPTCPSCGGAWDVTP